MSKFKTLVTEIYQNLKEYERDDPSDNPWNISKDQAKEIAKINPTIQSKNSSYTQTTIQPVRNLDLVYIKQITVDTQDLNKPSTVMWLTNKNQTHRTYEKENASLFRADSANKWLAEHPRFKTADGRYEIHYEIEAKTIPVKK